MVHVRHEPIQLTGRTIEPVVKGCPGSQLIAHRPFNGRSCCPFCMKDLKVKKDNTFPQHSGKRKEYL